LLLRTGRKEKAKEMKNGERSTGKKRLNGGGKKHGTGSEGYCNRFTRGFFLNSFSDRIRM